MTSDLPSPTREGELIRLARMRATPRLSIRAAAAKAGISAETWGYVERGYQSLGQGKPVRVHIPPADTLAHMANVVGLSPERLEEIGRADAAKVLREIRRSTPPEGHTHADETTWVAGEQQHYRGLLHEDAIRRGFDRTGQLVDGLDLKRREDQLWDAIVEILGPRIAYENVLHVRDLDEAPLPRTLGRDVSAVDDRGDTGNGTEG